MSRRVLVIGASGYVGRCYVNNAKSSGLAVRGTGRRPDDLIDSVTSRGDELDQVLEDWDPHQVVTTVQLRSMDAAWVLERIDGPRWVVLSSAQLASKVPAPNTREGLLNEELALMRGAVVVRPTMVFGHGGDLNISRMIRQLQKLGVSLQVGGEQLIQPIHVDDLSNFLIRHALNEPVPPSLVGAPVELGGEAQMAMAELIDDLVQLTGARGPRVKVDERLLGRLGAVATLADVRRDQIARLTEDKVVDNSVASEALGWVPMATPHRLEQAVEEVTGE